jgi:threonine-phosphate decarboxylase
VSRQTNFIPLREHLLKVQPCKHGGLVRKTSQKYNIPEAEILDASASLNPYGTPFDHPYTGLDMDKILYNALERIGQYPDNRYLDFRNAAAAFVGKGITAENIIPGNGSSEIIRLVAETVIEKGDKVLIPSPTFSEYEQQCSIFGAEIQYIKQEMLPDIPANILKGARLLFVCNPNNPTGKLFTREEMQHLLNKCRDNGVIIFVDEAFIELADPSQTIVDLVEDNDNLFIQRSLTKAFAIPGIRMGFGVASVKIATLLNNARLSWNIGIVAEAVSTALMNMEGGCYSRYMIESREMIARERDFLMEKLERRGFKPIKSSVNYIFVDISDLSMDSVELTERMAKHGVLIRDCSSFQDLGKNHIRIAVRTRAENERIINCIREVIQEWGREQAIIYLQRNLAEAREKGPVGSNRECNYYPCHFEGQDCTFCFCPFYPCLDERTEGKWIVGSSGKEVWSCLECRIVHEPAVVQKIISALIAENGSEEAIKKVWKDVMEPILCSSQ